MAERVCLRCQRSLVGQKAVAPIGKQRYKCRGLCTSCYAWAHRYGHLADYPRQARSLAEVVEEHAFLASQGLRDDEIAARLGMKLGSLRDALRNHRTRERAA